MKQLLSIIAAVIILASCSSITEPVNTNKKVKARLQQTVYIASCGCYNAWGNEITVAYIDPLYKVGDVVDHSGIKLMVASIDSGAYAKGDYQLDVYEDSTVIWDGNRHVSTLKYDSTQALDKVILDDNQ